MRRLSLVFPLLFIGGFAVWAEPPDKPNVSPANSEVEQLIRQLGDKRFNVREQATRKLWSIGAPAETAVRRATKDADPEVARRAKELIDKFELGMYPDTPAPVLAELERFRHGDDDTRRDAAQALIAHGVDGFTALGRLKARAKTDDERKMLVAMLTRAAMNARVGMLQARDYGALEKLLEACLDQKADEAIASYTALIVLRDKLPATLARWQAEHTAAPTPRTAQMLASLYRAAGDWPNARKYAADRPDLLEEMLWEQGDWAELAKRKTIDSPPIDPAVRAAYHRLAGNVKEADALVEQLKQPADPSGSRLLAMGLLLNERPGDALKHLATSPEFAFDLLVAQLRYREAFQAAKKPAPVDENRRPFIEVFRDGVRKFALKQANVNYQMGERDQALQQFAKLAAECRTPSDGPMIAEMIETQSRLGLNDLSMATAAGYLSEIAKNAPDDATHPAPTVLGALFDKRGIEAQVWWDFFRQKFPKEDEAAAMRRLRNVLGPEATTNPSLKDMTADLVAAESSDDANAMSRAHKAAAAAFEAAQQFDRAADHLASAAELSQDGSLWIRVGDLQGKRQQWLAAADAYAKAAKRDPTNPLPVYLNGWAQQRAGRGPEAAALLDYARMLPLGDLYQRATVVQELTRRGMLDLARAERALVLKLGWRRVWAVGGFLSLMSRDAAAQKDFARAADGLERVMIGVVESAAGDEGVSFVDNVAFVSVPALAHAYRARAALVDGRLDAVRSEADACLALTPGNLDLPILLVPEFVKRGRAADADALYQRSADAIKALCKDYPSSSYAHNSAAWLAACCRRDLDAALQHAQRATELAPKHAGYRDTLAEVHFQRGDKEKAIALMRECQRMEPKNAYFVKQMKRFEAGDPSVPPPPETADD